MRRRFTSMSDDREWHAKTHDKRMQPVRRLNSRSAPVAFPQFGSKIIDVEFVWNSDNVEHVGKHGLSPREAEYLVEHAQPPYPQMIGDEKRIVVGRLADGRYAQVIYVPSRSVRGAVFVIHARELTQPEKRRLRRRKR
jgi:uncharacterized DUF497 family protein